MKVLEAQRLENQRLEKEVTEWDYSFPFFNRWLSFVVGKTQIHSTHSITRENTSGRTAEALLSVITDNEGATL